MKTRTGKVYGVQQSDVKAVKAVETVKTGSKQTGGVKKAKTARRQLMKTIRQIRQAAKKTCDQLANTIIATYESRLLPDALTIGKEELDNYSSLHQERHQNTWNSVSHVSAEELAQNRDFLQSVNYAYNFRMPIAPQATEQAQSGRCWMFAALNSMRYQLMTKHNLDSKFELSEAFLFFYDKLERSHYYLNRIIELRKAEPSPLLYGIMGNPTEDGGTWTTFSNLINKYGIVPKSCFDESFNSSCSDEMNMILRTKLQYYTNQIRSAKSDLPDDDLRKYVTDECMSEIYSLLVRFIGKPPDQFDWSYHEASGNYEAVLERGPYHKVAGLTPLTFFHEYIDKEYQINNKVVLRHDPRVSSEYYRTYSCQGFGAMTGGTPDLALNVPIEELAEAVLASIIDEKPVWFSCDVSKSFNSSKAVLATEAYDYQKLFDTPLDLDKASALTVSSSAPTHAMLFVGADVEPSCTTGTTIINKWRVENSWGSWYWTEDPGYLLMSHDWFKRHVYEVVVDSSFLSERARAAYEEFRFDPILLPYYDPFGAVAGCKCQCTNMCRN